MVKLNSTTAILSDLDGVILDLSYDIKFWELWLPEHVADQTNQSIEKIPSKDSSRNRYTKRNSKFL